MDMEHAFLNSVNDMKEMDPTKCAKLLELEFYLQNREFLNYIGNNTYLIFKCDVIMIRR